MGDYRFTSWIRNIAPFYNELSERVDKPVLEQYKKKALPRNIIRTVITLLNSHNFAANDNIDHRYVRRINLESLQHFVERVYSHREILPVPPSSPPSFPPETSHREPQEPSIPFFNFYRILGSVGVGLASAVWN